MKETLELSPLLFLWMDIQAAYTERDDQMKAPVPLAFCIIIINISDMQVESLVGPGPLLLPLALFDCSVRYGAAHLIRSLKVSAHASQYRPARPDLPCPHPSTHTVTRTWVELWIIKRINICFTKHVHRSKKLFPLFSHSLEGKFFFLSLSPLGSIATTFLGYCHVDAMNQKSERKKREDENNGDTRISQSK